MKKTLTVNLNGIVFNIDDDAYDVLNKYLADIASHFSLDEEKDEIIADIEARIAELFGEKLQRNKEVITLADVQDIISVMGNPSQFADSDEEQAQSSNTERKKKKPRRFYRDPSNAILGGVFGGIAAQFNWDVTIVRVVAVILFFILSLVGGGWFIIVFYILAWIIAPNAVTPSQRLEMQGEEVTVENIKAEFDNVKNYVESEKFKESTRSVGYRLGEIFKWILKILGGIIAGVLAFGGFILVIVLFALLVSAIFAPAFFFDFIPEWGFLVPENSVLLIISLLLVVGCPIFLFIYGIVRLASGHRSKSRTAFWVALVLWLAGIFMLIGVGTKSAVSWKNNYGEVWSLSWNNTNDTDEIRTVDDFKAIDVSGTFKIILEESPNQLLVVSAGENFMHRIITEVRDETLFIHSNGITLNELIEVRISTQYIDKIVARGASEIETDFKIKSDNLYMLLQGASKAELDVDIQDTFKMDLEGASKVELEGSCQNLRIKAVGASKIDAEGLYAKHAKVNVSGASSASLYASESLSADASGAAKITCKGSPKKVTKTDRIGTSISIR
ncbi:PspC domain-containing protein [Paludibacter sp. 221]|uniref:GIN domain-containing protein n=1 Tax=Paludibacter sp. 221 TaxID=2302939 RepID=UPI0013D71648|nr:DUF2807 domain-containing protein [Paludibacter sp. 221]NDV47706.1 PspC domain-containing protein [Paludibacter sp. 221]